MYSKLLEELEQLTLIILHICISEKLYLPLFTPLASSNFPSLVDQCNFENTCTKFEYRT